MAEQEPLIPFISCNYLVRDVINISVTDVHLSAVRVHQSSNFREAPDKYTKAHVEFARERNRVVL